MKSKFGKLADYVFAASVVATIALLFFTAAYDYLIAIAPVFVLSGIASTWLSPRSTRTPYWVKVAKTVAFVAVFAPWVNRIANPFG